MIVNNVYLTQRNRRAGIRQDRRPKGGELAEEAKAERGYRGAAPIVIITAHVGGPECTISYNHAVANYTCAHGTFVEDEDSAYVHAHEKAREINRPFLRFLQSHPNMFPMLQLLLQRLGLY